MVAVPVPVGVTCGLTMLATFASLVVNVKAPALLVVGEGNEKVGSVMRFVIFDREPIVGLGFVAP